MSLYEWLNREGHTQSYFAHLMGVSAPTVSSWLRGRRPSRELLIKLQRLTKSAVTAKDFPLDRKIMELPTQLSTPDWMYEDQSKVNH